MIRKSDAEKNGVATMDGGSRLQAGNEALRRKLQELLPPLVNSDGQLDLKSLKDIMDVANGGGNDQGYELTFAGKGYARAQASAPTAHELKAVPAQSKHFDTTKNVVIRGDNLDALKILYQNYFGKIKMIYIDPPYNTGDDFIYKDNFKVSDEQLIEQFDMKPDTVDFLQNVYGTYSHSGWLTFMYPRLKLARELLSDDGVIFISIDDNEAANLRIICDEIFGHGLFVGNIAWESKTKSQNTKSAFDKLQPKVEHILCYAMKEKPRFNLMEAGSKAYPENDEKGSFRYAAVEVMSAIGIRGRDSMRYPIEGIYPPDNRQWQVGEEMIVEYKTRGDLLVKKGKPYLKMRPEDERTEKTVPFWAFFSKEWGTTESAKKELSEILQSSNHEFETVKPSNVIMQLIFHATNQDSYILDFFAGSGTTGDAVMRLNAEDGGNRKFVLVQWDEKISAEKNAHKFCTDNGLEPVISSITLERLNRAGDKVKAEIDAHNKTASDEDKKAMPDIGYKVYSTTLKPTITDAAENEQVQLQLNNQRATVLDTLTNMLCATGKTLDTRIECLIEDVLYQADDEMYLLDAVDAAVLAPHKDKKLNLNGWSDIDLEGLLNSGLHTGDEITVIY